MIGECMYCGGVYSYENERQLYCERLCALAANRPPPAHEVARDRARRRARVWCWVEGSYKVPGSPCVAGLTHDQQEAP